MSALRKILVVENGPAVNEVCTRVLPAKPYVAFRAEPAGETVERVATAPESRVKMIALFAVAPFVALCYAVLLPFVGIGLLVTMAIKALAAKPIAKAALLFVRNVALLVAAPFVGLLYVVALLFFGAAAFQQSALAWASQHRDHHRYVDTDNDPYNIKKGFFWAHMGWLFFGKYRFYYANAGDLVDSKLVLHQARHYPLWSLTAGVIVPMILGVWAGHALGAFILCVCFRTVFVHHGSWCINSVCHTFGKKTYDARSSARDHWLVALITFGEGYHNFHHRFPNDYRNGIKWYHWDPSKWILFLFEKLGLVWKVKRASESRILEAKLKAAEIESMTGGKP